MTETPRSSPRRPRPPPLRPLPIRPTRPRPSPRPSEGESETARSLACPPIHRPTERTYRTPPKRRDREKPGPSFECTSTCRLPSFLRREIALGEGEECRRKRARRHPVPRSFGAPPVPRSAGATTQARAGRHGGAGPRQLVPLVGVRRQRGRDDASEFVDASEVSDI